MLSFPSGKNVGQHVASHDKRLCKSVVSSPQVLVRKIKMRWCVVFFFFLSRSFVQTDNNNINKQTKQINDQKKKKAIPRHCFKLLFLFYSTKQPRGRMGCGGGWGLRSWCIFCQFGLVVHPSVHFATTKQTNKPKKNKKSSSGLQLSATVDMSSNKYLNFYVLCFFFMCVFVIHQQLNSLKWAWPSHNSSHEVGHSFKWEYIEWIKESGVDQYVKQPKWSSTA